MKYFVRVFAVFIPGIQETSIYLRNNSSRTVATAAVHYNSNSNSCGVGAGAVEPCVIENWSVPHCSGSDD